MVLVLDESTAMLDPKGRKEVLGVAEKLNKEQKTTVIAITHYMEEAEALSDRIAIMKDGRLLCCDTAARIKETAGTDRFEEAFVAIVKGVQP